MTRCVFFSVDSPDNQEVNAWLCGYNSRMLPREKLTPKVAVSACLGFSACRYDGTALLNSAVDELRSFFDFATFCPETEAGMPSPRPPIDLVESFGSVSVINRKTNENHTPTLEQASKRLIQLLPKVDGWIFKSRSPSCGLDDAKFYVNCRDETEAGRRDGLFASYVQQHDPFSAKTDERRLADSLERHRFYSHSLALALTKSNDLPLDKVHARLKYLLMSYHPGLATRLGQIASNGQKDDYRKMLAEVFQEQPTEGRLTNALEHIAGYFRHERKRDGHRLDSALQECDWKTAKRILYQWAREQDNDYILSQVLLREAP